MSCAEFSPTSPVCRTVTVIEPDATLLSSTSTGSVDQSLEEVGSLSLLEGQSVASVTFNTIKAGEDYRFEYLYVDALGFTPPGDIQAVPIVQTVYGFTVDLTGSIHAGYILRWRVVVIEFGVAGVLDAPETIYRRLPQTPIYVVVLVNPRTTTDYHFEELRVENLIDPVEEQTPVAIQVVAKTTGTFSLGINPTPPTTNYFLAAKTA
jgi:hypothetical protein